MKTTFKKMTAALGLVLVASLLTATAVAQCGNSVLPKAGAKVRPQSWQGADAAKLQFVSEATDPIVGLWHVTFTAEGNPDGPPNGTPIDNALVTWHSDNTEIMNSARPPQDGNLCIGLWEKRGQFYKVSHIPWSANDTANAPTGIGNPTGPTHIVEYVILDPDGNHYHGTFTLDAFDTQGNSTAHILGVLKGTRITVDTSIKSLM